MDTDRVNDLRAFRSFVDQKLSNGEATPTLDDVLACWEYENQSQAERDDTVQAIWQGLADVESGRVRAFGDFDREFRQKHGLSARA